jgi:hypothetical protein
VEWSWHNTSHIESKQQRLDLRKNTHRWDIFESFTDVQIGMAYSMRNTIVLGT